MTVDVINCVNHILILEENEKQEKCLDFTRELKRIILTVPAMTGTFLYIFTK